MERSISRDRINKALYLGLAVVMFALYAMGLFRPAASAGSWIVNICWIALGAYHINGILRHGIA